MKTAQLIGFAWKTNWNWMILNAEKKHNEKKKKKQSLNEPHRMNFYFADTFFRAFQPNLDSFVVHFVFHYRPHFVLYNLS